MNKFEDMRRVIGQDMANTHYQSLTLDNKKFGNKLLRYIYVSVEIFIEKLTYSTRF